MRLNIVANPYISLSALYFKAILLNSSSFKSLYSGISAGSLSRELAIMEPMEIVLTTISDKPETSN